MRARLRSESGYVVPLALAVIAIVAGFSAVAIALATHNVDRSTRDRASLRALAAADAGLDAAAYRLNRTLVASRIEGFVPYSGGAGEDALQTLLTETAGCLSLGVGSLEVNFAAGTCAASSDETIDATVDDDGLGPSAKFRYYVRTGVNVLVAGEPTVERRVVSVGEVDGVTGRAMGVYRVELDAAELNALFERELYVTCTDDQPPGGDPTVGCPDV